MSIGYKIKMLRGQRGMTQNDLADGIISRAMLSRIESGSATPSVATLNALAEKLQISPGFLMEDGSDLLPAERERLIRQITLEYAAGNMEDCLHLFSVASFSDPAYNALHVSAGFTVAIQAFSQGAFDKAYAVLEEVEQLLPALLIPVPTVSEERISLLRSIMDNISDLEAVYARMEAPDLSFAPSVFLFHLRLLSEGKTDTSKTLFSLCPIPAVYEEYISAQHLIREYKFIDAIIKLKTLASKAECPYFLSLLCYSSMENCCKLCEDYKGAYDYHIKRQDLLNICKKSS